MTTFTPTTPTEALAAVEWALANESPLEIIGHGSKRGLGRPLQTEHTLDVSNLTGVTLYEPEELVLSARAGTPLAEIEKLLADHGQELAFEPMDYGPLLGQPAGRGTIGGVLAANLAGPRRLKAGAARDHILGINAVSGRGEAFKSGGRVVKNVTGYDLSKAMAGSWGTLAVLTDVTFKVLPAAETEVTLAIRGLFDDGANAAMALALGSSEEVSSAAHVPENLAGSIASGALKGASATLLRVEGFGPSVAFRTGKLIDLLKNAGPIDEISGDASKAIWRDIRDCTPFADGTERPVWRVSMAPAQAHAMVMALRMEEATDAIYDWQGGLVWLRLQADPEADLLRRLVRKFGGGHATLVRANHSLRASLAVFEPQPQALAGLSARLKEQFDPKGILNPGRMVPLGKSATLDAATGGKS
ncbi:glycolate oxidase subunit GlcE [Mesorhizobium sp. YR577]|uniref:glycolate oxidase subunit GlcE n=1 Tax=Mesorhizobium sp. YR577 TaxID=1884373 RepID=UPI0008E5F424|nr:glycolate oxidase subunit GlcE [Mesorhizobium sp. YR577]SFU00355.1 glycolate oxidase FAD binding subunit [Mesorhizobium sp. YR577]